MNILHRLLTAGLIAVCLTASSGCSLISHFQKPTPQTARQLYQAGISAMENEEYTQAVEHLTNLKERFPFSELTTKAELKLADAYYLDGQLKAAEDAYKEFEMLHPGDESIPFVLFRIGVCNFKQFRSIDLPMQNLGEALQYFKRVQQSYPESEYAGQAREYQTETRRLIAKHELYVADFYWRQGEYQAAWKRYSYVLKNFSDLESIRDYAQSRERLAYYKYQQQQAEKERAAQNGDWKQWFEWL